MPTQLTVQTELLRFLYSLLPGLLCGVLLDCFRTLRALLPHHPLAVFIEDALFSFLFCFILQCYAWSFCAGALRWQYGFGMLLGMTLWLLTAGAVWMRMVHRLKALCRKLLRAVFRKKTDPQKNISQSP